MAQQAKEFPHGRDNRVYLSKESVVVKEYIGPQAAERFTLEMMALDVLKNMLPVPKILAADSTRNILHMHYIQGLHGKDMLDSPEQRSEILYICGRLLKELQKLPASLLFGCNCQRDTVIVHGDLGPHNVIVDPENRNVVGLIDWEEVYAGEPVEDLARIEWLVRIRRPHYVNSLPALFEGYGQKPDWETRHSAMLCFCQAKLVLFESYNMGEQALLWKQHLETTVRYKEL